MIQEKKHLTQIYRSLEIFYVAFAEGFKWIPAGNNRIQGGHINSKIAIRTKTLRLTYAICKTNKTLSYYGVKQSFQL